MDYSTTQNGNTVSISFRGEFGFSDNPKTQQIIKDVKESSCSGYSIDLSGLESIDSAGLGMLLLINDAAEEGGKNLELCSPTGQVRKMLEISKFSEIISIK
ncbi:STAS domain-containing protein [Kiloniella sp. EL199]|uniref:STAS domain-containing protein n=1 Tax=Kiloniella sp. EL199 TaxID=2107581 RepID=UPI0013C450EF|nr:STAS domain-containing protein [Kiloniella sp. EL199]